MSVCVCVHLWLIKNPSYIPAGQLASLIPPSHDSVVLSQHQMTIIKWRKEMTKSSTIREKSYQFAVEVARLYKDLQVQNEYVLSRNLVRSGTSIGAIVEEAATVRNGKDYYAKIAVASKEAREAKYWLRLLSDSKIVQKVDFSGPLKKADELIKLLADTMNPQNKKDN